VQTLTISATYSYMMATAGQAKAKQQKFECSICKKLFESLEVMNSHKQLEHSESKRPPIGVG
jgi:hypothetical protein